MADLSVLESSQGDERRNAVGNAVYPVIQRVFGDQYAAKITGMVIDETAVDVKRLFHDQSYFQKHVNDAYALLSLQFQPQPGMNQQTPQ